MWTVGKRALKKHSIGRSISEQDILRRKARHLLGEVKQVTAELEERLATLDEEALRRTVGTADNPLTLDDNGTPSPSPGPSRERHTSPEGTRRPYSPTQEAKQASTGGIQGEVQKGHGELSEKSKGKQPDRGTDVDEAMEGA
jgi:hypothetical protein